MSKDYYDILGISSGASEGDIKKAYRKMAMKWHPDRNRENKTEAEGRFKEVNEAFDVLSDTQKRAAYDRYGHDAFKQHQQGGGGHAASHHHQQGGFEDIFQDIFGNFMGGSGEHARSSSSSTAGADVRVDTEITLEEAFRGSEIIVESHTFQSCDTCHGSGAQGGEVKTCASCRGSGVNRVQQGFFMMERTCSTCRGEGKVIKNPCRTCRTTGRVKKDRRITVKIPPGIDHGDVVRMRHYGEAGLRGGTAGDLLIVVQLKSHAFFKRKNKDLFLRMTIDMTTAALGGSIEVPTIEGQRLKIKIPEGTQTDHQFRVKDHGMPKGNHEDGFLKYSTQRGDMYITTWVETPVNLTPDQKKILQDFRQHPDGVKNQPESESFLAKIKDYFWSNFKSDEAAS